LKLNDNLISLGIESYSNKVLRFIKKGGTEKKIREAIKHVTDFGFKVRLFFIIGFPYETKKSLKRFYTFILRYPIHQLRFFNLISYEQTELMDWLRINGKLLYLPDEYMNYFAKYRDIPVFEARYTMSPEDRAKELRIARKIAAIMEKKNKL